MDDGYLWGAIGALTLATAFARCALWLVGHRVSIPPRVQDMLRYAPACALAAIIAPDVMLDARGGIVLDPANPKLLAAGAAVAYYLWRRNMLQTIIIGMLVFTVLRVSHVFGNLG